MRVTSLACVAAIGVLAGCGSSGSPPVAGIPATTAAGTHAAAAQPSQDQLQQDALRYAQCMRAHGVPNFPDPRAGGGFEFKAGTIDRSSPAFRAAQAKCQSLMPAGPATAGSTTHPSAEWLAKMVKAAQCMRRHGIAGFPDPTTTVPSLNGFDGVISNIDGVIFVFPSSLDIQSPAFARAAKACGFPLHNH